MAINLERWLNRHGLSISVAQYIQIYFQDIQLVVLKIGTAIMGRF